MWEDFKTFAMRGNVVDLAIGVIIGAAFGKIVSSLVDDIIMPLIALFIGDISFTELQYKGIMYGNFIQSAFDFFIIAFSIFMFIRIIMKLDFRKKQDEEAPIIETQEDLLKDIRDLLKKQDETK